MDKIMQFLEIERKQGREEERIRFYLEKILRNGSAIFLQIQLHFYSDPEWICLSGELNVKRKRV
ncbi:hypothetical protein LguiA_024430 [Lonicera macranthoides]